MCFQFPAIVNIGFDAQSTSLENPPQDEVKRHAAESLNSKNSSTAVNRLTSLCNNDSSGTDVCTDTDDDDDDDDDILTVREERKSLFSALKSRMNDRELGKSCSSQSKPPKVITVKETPGCLGGECAKKGTKSKRTSTIVDMSFSDDESQEDCQSKLNSLIQSYATKTQTSNQDDCLLVETQKGQVNKAGPPHNNARKKCSEIRDRELMTSSSSKHDTDSCEDSDDLPCVLPSSLYSGSESNSYSYKSLPSSCTDNCKSSYSRSKESNMDSQSGSEIPAKRKKRSAEEIMRQRHEALVSTCMAFIMVLTS